MLGSNVAELTFAGSDLETLQMTWQQYYASCKTKENLKEFSPNTSDKQTDTIGVMLIG